MKTKMIGYLMYRLDDADHTYTFSRTALSGPDHDSGLHSFPIFRRLETTPDEVAEPLPIDPPRGTTINGVWYVQGVNEHTIDFKKRMDVIAAAMGAVPVASAAPAMPTPVAQQPVPAAKGPLVPRQTGE